MRAYKIVVGNGSSGLNGTWTNLLDTGKLDLGAPNIEMDISVGTLGVPVGASSVRIWGPSKKQISQASNYNGLPIKVYAGMAKGFPLATMMSDKYGKILDGTIFQAFSNWQGLVQTLDFIVLANASANNDQSNPANLQFNAPNGTDIKLAIQSTLSNAFPQATINLNISKALIAPQDYVNTSETITQFAHFILGISQDIGGKGYNGVSISQDGNNINVFDNAQSQSAKTINIKQEELIGSVTWLDSVNIQFSTPIRSDLSIGATIKLPESAGTQAITPAGGSNSNARNGSSFTGEWIVSPLIRHIGQFRDASAASWITTIQAFSNAQNTTTQDTTQSNSAPDTIGPDITVVAPH